MFKKQKERLCKKCQTPLYETEKECPVCGTKNIKPFYKNEWFIAILVVLVLAGIGYYRKYYANKFNWNDLVLSHVLPEPNSTFGEISVNSSKYLIIDIYKTTKQEFNEYVESCKTMGFVIEKESGNYSYNAYNKEGYKLSLWYYEDVKEMNIHLDAPMEMENLYWPNREIVNYLPVPKSNIGKIVTESADYFSVYVSNMSKEDYSAYIDECYQKGFTIDYHQGNGYFVAKNSEGYEIYVSYEGNSIINIWIKKLDN